MRVSQPQPVPSTGRVIVITGAMAAGKSTVAEMLAHHLPRSVHIRGDSFRRMIVNGRAEMTLHPTAEARAQLDLRYDLAAHVALAWAGHGFDAIVQDVIIGDDLPAFIERLTGVDRFLVVLSPSVSALEWRERQRDKRSETYMSVGAMDNTLRNETTRLGYWLDSSAQTPEETVGDILEHLERARV
ncbi:phosphotransferase-like protein [Enemella sp. A6]|uniref:phosphotransferase-like protein n=1 Tax=Enemella sp. A6 TaxID=3440152 RepID=UPI003EBE9559